MPSVIRLNRYVNAPYKGVNLTRQNIFKRDNFECQYCGTKRELTIDHVTPRARGGKDTWTNLVTACKRCNAKKGNHTLDVANMTLRKRPYKPSYSIFLKDQMHDQVGDWDAFLSE
jgi:5-methylcytosine-specific restriction endonuclease McrA